MSLFISVATPSSGLSDSPITEAITLLASKVASEKQDGKFPHGPSLDVTFMLPGEEERPPFAGMRMGGYTTEEDTLYFETAVPEHIIHSQLAGQYVEMVMQDVIVHAEAFFVENDLGFDTQQWWQCVQRLAVSGANKATMQ
jgi:hypothetical protein